ncbi:MAG: response regulator [Chlorobiaceae bacterium]|nr:response regulator [Chlorobiaceae bacterium]
MKKISDILVLFVDDEGDTISGLKRFFRTAPFRKAFAGSGAEALRMLEEQEADVLVTDVLMPDMNGIELISLAKSMHPEMLCVLVTGSNDTDEIFKSADTENIFNYVMKPVDPVSFRKNIDSAVALCCTPHEV